MRSLLSCSAALGSILLSLLLLLPIAHAHGHAIAGTESLNSVAVLLSRDGPQRTWEDKRRRGEGRKGEKQEELVASFGDGSRSDDEHDDRGSPVHVHEGGKEKTGRRGISAELFADLEELSRVVDISYCVGVTGIRAPFECASRCADFRGWELVTTWNTGVLMSDSSGYMVLSHAPSRPRIILAFRGTYSIANTIVDLSTVPQEYIPYPGDEDEEEKSDRRERLKKRGINPGEAECTNCTVHAGFMRAWRETRPYVLPHLEEMVQRYPEYRVTLVGHSLGGAIAALASLDFQSRGWNPQTTTFGEPRIGNAGLVQYLDASFAEEGSTDDITETYRRVTHINDPVPLLPLTEWGYRMHAGEIFISKDDLSPEVGDLWFCSGNEDPKCIAGSESPPTRSPGLLPEDDLEEDAAIKYLRKRNTAKNDVDAKGIFEVPARWRIWELFFAHRDYFWRLGMCIPGGDPKDWYRKYPQPGQDQVYFDDDDDEL